MLTRENYSARTKNSELHQANAKILRAIYWHTRIKAQKCQIFLANKGLLTYVKFLDRFLRPVFYLNTAKVKNNKEAKDKEQNEIRFLNDSFGTPNKGLNHAKAGSGFNFIINATNKIPRINHTWISSLIDIVFFKGIAKANGLAPSEKSMRGRVSLEQLKKKEPTWHICDFLTYTNLMPSQHEFYRQENDKTCPFCKAMIKASQRSRYGYNRYKGVSKWITRQEINFHKESEAFKETVKILSEYNFTNKIRYSHTDVISKSQQEKKYNYDHFIPDIYKAFIQDPAITIAPQLKQMYMKHQHFHMDFSTLILLIGHGVINAADFISKNKNQKISKDKNLEQVKTILQKLSYKKPQELSDQNVRNSSFNYATAFDLYDVLQKIIAERAILIDSSTELKKYLDNLEKAIQLCNRLIQEERILTDKKRIEISNDALFYILQTCKHFDKLSQDFIFLGLMHETIVFLTLGEHVFEKDKTSFKREGYEQSQEEKKHLDNIFLTLG